MSFASDARGELARDLCGHVCCARSELAAALLSSGGISYRGKNRYALSLTAADASVVRRYFALLKQFWGITGQIRTLVSDSLSGQTRYQLMIPEEESLRLLEETMLLDDSALFGVHYHTLIRGDGDVTAEELLQAHQTIYRDNLAPEVYSRFIQIPLPQGEQPRPAQAWVEEGIEE